MEGTAIQKNGSWLVLATDSTEIVLAPDVDTSVLYDNCFVTYELTDSGLAAITAHRPQHLSN